MSLTQTALLGALAGVTIYLGLPAGRLQRLTARGRVALAMFSVGVLVFLLVDVLSHGFGIAEGAVSAFRDRTGGFGRAAGMAALLVGGFGLGSAGLGILERRLRRSAPRSPAAGGATDVMSPDDHRFLAAERARALQTGLIVATAIGLHNFAEAWPSACRRAPARSPWPRS